MQYNTKCFKVKTLFCTWHAFIHENYPQCNLSALWKLYFWNCIDEGNVQYSILVAIWWGRGIDYQFVLRVLQLTIVVDAELGMDIM